MSKSGMASEPALDELLDRALLACLAESLPGSWNLHLAVYDKSDTLVWHQSPSEMESLAPNCLSEQSWLENLAQKLSPHDAAAASAAENNVEAAMAALQCEQKRVGTLAGFRSEVNLPREAGPGIESFLGGQARLLSKLMDAARATDDLAEELLNRYEELALVHEVSQALNMEDDLETTLERVFTPIRTAFAADSLHFEVPYLGLSRHLPEMPWGDDDSSELLKAIWKHTSDEDGCVLNHITKHPALGAAAGAAHHALVLAMRVDGSPGRLIMLRHTQEDRFFAGDLTLLSSVGTQVSTFISNARVTFYRKELLHSSLFGLSKLAECRDEDTGEHLHRVSLYCKILSEKLLEIGKYADELRPEFLESIFRTSPLHDIGKVGISDAILLKPGKLTAEEFEEMKKHTSIGGNTLREVGDHMRGNGGFFLEIAQQIAYFHHEKWDGSGYQTGISGTDIPLAARIMALADVYDALTSERCYKKAFSVEKAKSIILEGRGSHFDPDVVDAFLSAEDQFMEVKNAHGNVL